MKNDIAVVIVTYNRKELLEKCINSLLKQTYEKFDIFIIDNASTDGTYDYIKKYIDESKIYYINTNENIGGAGGFNYGMKEVLRREYSYIWLMDDDTLPKRNALLELVDASEILEGDYGFLSSIVLWKDGNGCEMNKQKIKQPWFTKVEHLKHSLLLTYYATFVSFFVKSEVVYEQGLPIKEFFIWGDDVEYSNRLAKKYDCYIVGKSQVVHYTDNNVGSNIAKDSTKRLLRYKYAYRNEMFIARKAGVNGFLRQTAKIVLHISRIIFQSKSCRFKKIWIVLSSSINGLFFNPKIEIEKK